MDHSNQTTPPNNPSTPVPPIDMSDNATSADPPSIVSPVDAHAADAIDAIVAANVQPPIDTDSLQSAPTTPTPTTPADQSSTDPSSSEPSDDNTKPISEETPLLTPSESSASAPAFYRPAFLTDTNEPVPEVHSRFGFQPFLDDISDLQNGSVPVSVMIAVVIGFACGVAAFVYYKLLEFFLEYLWKTLPETIAEAFPIWTPCFHFVWIPIVGMTMAVLVGLSIKLLGYPGDLAYTVKCVHKDAYVPMSHAPSMVMTSQVSILGGGSLGPEAPLVAICASIAGWVSIHVFRQKYKNVVRKHTLCGMACALAAFFGVPLGGSLFALEINNRLGYEYFEHALEAILSGTVCLVVFRGIAGLPIGPLWFFTDERLGDSSASLVCVGAVLGLIGAGIAAVFAHGHWALMKKLKSFGWDPDRDPLKYSIFGGIGICILGVLVPHTLFWGEMEMQTIGSLSPASALPHIWPTTGMLNFEITGAMSAFIVGVAKLVAISFTVAGGYRGGFIFPFFCAGTAFGRCVTYLIPSIPPTVAILSIAAGINVTITRTALATPLILAALAGEVNATSPVLAASLVAVFVTYYLPFIFTQQGREQIFESQLHSYTFKDKWGEIGEAPEISLPNEQRNDVESH